MHPFTQTQKLSEPRSAPKLHGKRPAAPGSGGAPGLATAAGQALVALLLADAGRGSRPYVKGYDVDRGAE
jgi:hypothetical protein